MTPRHTAHLSTRRAALAAETGFTLVELLVSLAIVGVLLVIAVPAYLNFQAKSQPTAALSALREVIPSANAYYVENSGLTISNGDSTGIVSADAEGNASRTASRRSPTVTGRTTAAREERSSPTRARSPRTPAHSPGC